jgi:hypothetical protein
VMRCIFIPLLCDNAPEAPIRAGDWKLVEYLEDNRLGSTICERREKQKPGGARQEAKLRAQLYDGEPAFCEDADGKSELPPQANALGPRNPRWRYRHSKLRLKILPNMATLQ